MFSTRSSSLLGKAISRAGTAKCTYPATSPATQRWLSLHRKINFCGRADPHLRFIWVSCFRRPCLASFGGATFFDASCTSKIVSLTSRLGQSPSRTIAPAAAVSAAAHAFSTSATLGAPRDTYNPSHRVRKRRHGFLSRVKTRKGRAILTRRRLKGRQSLSH